MKKNTSKGLTIGGTQELLYNTKKMTYLFFSPSQKKSARTKNLKFSNLCERRIEKKSTISHSQLNESEKKVILQVMM